jgi:hypothetical protein
MMVWSAVPKSDRPFAAGQMTPTDGRTSNSHSLSDLVTKLSAECGYRRLLRTESLES